MMATTALRNAALLAFGTTVWCGGASGMPSCQGTYAAMSLQPTTGSDVGARPGSPMLDADKRLNGAGYRF